MVSTANLKGKYLARCALWDWHDNSTIDITDDQNHVNAHLDEWQTLVFFEADGNITVEEIIASLSAKYEGQLPKDYNAKIIDSTKKLIEEIKGVELWDHKEDLPYYYEWPLKEQFI